jgi:hypothetical protein
MPYSQSPCIDFNPGVMALRGRRDDSDDEDKNNEHELDDSTNYGNYVSSLNQSNRPHMHSNATSSQASSICSGSVFTHRSSSSDDEDSKRESSQEKRKSMPTTTSNNDHEITNSPYSVTKSITSLSSSISSNRKKKLHPWEQGAFDSLLDIKPRNDMEKRKATRPWASVQEQDMNNTWQRSERKWGSSPSIHTSSKSDTLSLHNRSTTNTATLSSNEERKSWTNSSATSHQRQPTKFTTSKEGFSFSNPDSGKFRSRSMHERAKTEPIAITATAVFSSLLGYTNTADTQPTSKFYHGSQSDYAVAPIQQQKPTTLASLFRLEEEEVADDFEQIKVKQGIELARSTQRTKQKTTYEIDNPRVSKISVRPQVDVKGIDTGNWQVARKGEALDDYSDSNSDSVNSIDRLDELLHPDLVDRQLGHTYHMHSRKLSHDSIPSLEASIEEFRTRTQDYWDISQEIKEEAEEQLNNLDHAEAVINTFNEILEQSEQEQRRIEMAMYESLPLLDSIEQIFDDVVENNAEDVDIALQLFMMDVMQAVQDKFQPPKAKLTDLFKWSERENIDRKERAKSDTFDTSSKATKQVSRGDVLFGLTPKVENENQSESKSTVITIVNEEKEVPHLSQPNSLNDKSHADFFSPHNQHDDSPDIATDRKHPSPETTFTLSQSNDSNETEECSLEESLPYWDSLDPQEKADDGDSFQALNDSDNNNRTDSSVSVNRRIQRKMYDNPISRCLHDHSWVLTPIQEASEVETDPATPFHSSLDLNSFHDEETQTIASLPNEIPFSSLVSKDEESQKESRNNGGLNLQDGSNENKEYSQKKSSIRNKSTQAGDASKSRSNKRNNTDQTSTTSRVSHEHASSTQIAKEGLNLSWKHENDNVVDTKTVSPQQQNLQDKEGDKVPPMSLRRLHTSSEFENRDTDSDSHIDINNNEEISPLKFDADPNAEDAFKALSISPEEVLAALMRGGRTKDSITSSTRRSKKSHRETNLSSSHSASLSYPISNQIISEKSHDNTTLKAKSKIHKRELYPDNNQASRTTPVSTKQKETDASLTPIEQLSQQGVSSKRNKSRPHRHSRYSKDDNSTNRPSRGLSQHSSDDDSIDYNKPTFRKGPLSSSSSATITSRRDVAPGKVGLSQDSSVHNSITKGDRQQQPSSRANRNRQSRRKSTGTIDDEIQLERKKDVATSMSSKSRRTATATPKITNTKKIITR